MISKDMYTLLSAIPKVPGKIQYIDLLNGLLKKGFDPSMGRELLAYAHESGYIKASNHVLEHSDIELQERGMILIEEYERNIRSDVLMEKPIRHHNMLCGRRLPVQLRP